ncbi:MAG: hypothetical protein JWN68_1689 [Nocardioides sp.]|uniref:hypothetical protein n=1 Tax=Nocardioides sp. TaxID=35761 RepID=UPI002636D580|nr:hypothetical protein [Nocardioides sp.]MCW2833736.1 hypothetical protein [Nocardioides sp.]
MTDVHLHRRALLLGSLSVAATSALPGCSDAPDPVPTGSGPQGPDPTSSDPTNPTHQEAAIFDLSFTLKHRYRPFELVAPAFVAVERSGDQLAGQSDVSMHDEGPAAPFCAVQAQVDPGEGRVVLGLASPDGDVHLFGFYDPPTQRVGIEVRVDGRTRVLRRRKVQLPPSFGLAFVVCENQVTVLTDTDEGWQPVLTERDKVGAAIDLRQREVLSGLRYAWGRRGEEPGLTSVSAGLFGMTGVRDQHLVQHVDGTPYVRDGYAYFTGTCAGLGFFAQAHWGVFRLDLDNPRRLEQVSQLFSSRDGLVLGDHAGQVVRDDENDRWLVATSSWGDFSFDGVHVRHVVTEADVLTGVHVLDTVRTELPTEHSAWDPGITSIDGRWHVSFVESPSQEPFDFRPALAAGPAGGAGIDAFDDKLELVGAATDLHQCEGPILAQVQGEWWLLASDGDDRHYPVFDLGMHRVGRLDAPYHTNIPHPQLVPLDDGGHLVVTFDGTQYAERVMGYGGHGDVLIMRSRE